jgi:hypothetical protein
MKKSISVFFVLFILSSLLVIAQKQPDRLDGRAPKQHKSVFQFNTEDLATVYPQNVNYWTGTTDGATKTQTSLVNGFNIEDGWMVFDVSSIPAGATINSVTFNGYVNATSWPYWSVTPLALNPVTASASDIYAAIAAGETQTNAYSFNNESSSFTTGWKAYPLGGTVNADLGAALVNGWFAVGIASRDNSSSYYINFDGWNETNKPYLQIDYTVPVAHDVSTLSIDIADILPVAPFTPKATVKSNSNVSETFDVTMTIVNGSTTVYTSTKTVTSLAPGASIQVSFDGATPDVGTYTVTVCTQLGGDPVPANNCLDKVVNVQDLIQVYGYDAYNPISWVEGPISTSLQVPGTYSLLAPTISSQFIAGGTWVEGDWYGIEYFDGTTGGGFWTIDPSTGAMTLVGPTGAALSGLSYDVTTGVLYAVSITDLYTINMATGAATLVGPMGLTVAINLACSPTGQLYTVDINNDNLYSINKTTGATTLIGPIGFDASYAQDMEFDLDLGTCYMAAYNVTNSVGELRTVDIATGSTTLLGQFQNGAEVCGFAIPYNRIVPVELKSFSADINGANVTLNWSTASETNNSGFQIERSNGEEFEVIGFVAGFGTTTEVKSYSFADQNLVSGKYSYRLKQIDYDGTFEYSNTVEVEIIVKEFSLEQNYPNPFNPSTSIKFSLSVDSKVSLKVFNVLGQEVTTLINNQMAAGSHSATFDATKFNSGVYFYRIDVSGLDGQKFTSTKKMILTK